MKGGWGCVFLAWFPITLISALNPKFEELFRKIRNASKDSPYRPFLMQNGHPQPRANIEEILKKQLEKNHLLSGLHLARVDVNRELYKVKDRSCMHIEFDLKGANFTYETGDYLGLSIHNQTKEVERLEKLGNYSLDTVIPIYDHRKRYPFPHPCTYREAFTYFMDITSQPSQENFVDLAFYTQNRTQHRKLLVMAHPHNKKGRLEYENYVLKAKRSYLDVLEEYDDCKPPAHLLIRIVPPLKPRYYSISSSCLLSPLTVHITAVLVEYKNTTTGQIHRGEATTFLKKHCQPRTKKPFTIVPIFIRKSKFKLPDDFDVPILMIGPGTGIAPFRAFIEERDLMNVLGNEVADTILYYGCRRRDEDYLYGDELEEYVKKKTLKLRVAFSRETNEKVYVTHLLERNADEVWEVIGKTNGNLYVCGDAKTMGKDVHNTLIQIIKRKSIHISTTSQAEDFLKQLEKNNRYFSDVWE